MKNKLQMFKNREIACFMKDVTDPVICPDQSPSTG